MRTAALSLGLALVVLACGAPPPGKPTKVGPEPKPAVTKQPEPKRTQEQADAERARAIATELAQLPGVTPEAWQAATPEQRLETLREVEAINARVTLREPAKVSLFAFEVPASAELVYYGGYRIDANELLLSPALVEDPEQRGQALTTMLHCGRYAFQVAAVASPERYPDVDEATRREWSKPYVFPEVAGVEEAFDRVYMRPPGHGG